LDHIEHEGESEHALDQADHHYGSCDDGSCVRRGPKRPFGGGSIPRQWSRATFPTPLYTRWFNTYARIDQSVRFNYQSVGSGAGIAQIISRQVDFGASDAPMNDKQLAEAPGKILHFPTVLGADVITYNLPQLTEPLRFTGPVVADIFLGKITKWNVRRLRS